MDLSEYIFGKLYRLAKGARGHKTSPSEASLDGLVRILEVTFEAVTGTSVHVETSREFVGYYKGHLFLPKQIDISTSKPINERLYWMLTCVHATAVKDSLPWQPDKIMLDVCAQFPGLQACASVLRELGASKNTKSPDVNGFFGNKPVLETTANKKLGRKPDGSDDQDDQNSGERQSIIKKEGPNVAELKEFDNSSENPVVHFFEKVRTAESYTGGNKQREAEDSLEDMEDALKEVDLRTVIRSTERTPGLIKTNSIVESVESAADESQDDDQTPDVYYPEWHHEKRRYRPDWCAVFIERPPVERPLIIRTDSGQVIKSRFQSLFNHFLWNGKQLDGPDLDLAPVIENQISRRIGGALSERLFIKRIDQVKDLQVLVMMDESLSTESFLGQEMILSMMKASLADLLQGFEHAADQISLMSFFSVTRKRCTITVLKEFKDAIATGQARLAKCRPQGYTRIGVALRHASSVMGKSRSKKRCIILMTDSKPTDFDRYEGSYGIADVRKAAQEAITNGHDVIVLSYSDSHDEAFQRMFPAQVKVFSATTPREMNQRLLEIIERLAIP